MNSVRRRGPAIWSIRAAIRGGIAIKVLSRGMDCLIQDTSCEAAVDARVVVLWVVTSGYRVASLVQPQVLRFSTNLGKAGRGGQPRTRGSAPLWFSLEGRRGGP